MAEVALAVMLVIGAGLMIRTVYNLSGVDPGFDRSRLSRSRWPCRLSLRAARAAAAALSAAVRVASKDSRCAARAGHVGAAAEPAAQRQRHRHRQLHGAQAGPFENVDYYQSVMTGYFETMGIPIVEGRASQPATRFAGPGGDRQRDARQTFWKDRNPIGQQLEPAAAIACRLTVIGVAKDVKQGGVDKKTGTELYFLLDQFPRLIPTRSRRRR